jgi:hypothetical protein
MVVWAERSTTWVFRVDQPRRDAVCTGVGEGSRTTHSGAVLTWDADDADAELM